MRFTRYYKGSILHRWPGVNYYKCSWQVGIETTDSLDRFYLNGWKRFPGNHGSNGLWTFKLEKLVPEVCWGSFWELSFWEVQKTASLASYTKKWRLTVTRRCRVAAFSLLHRLECFNLSQWVVVPTQMSTTCSKLQCQQLVEKNN